MDAFAQWLGYLVMALGGVVLWMLALWWVVEMLWRLFVSGMNAADIMDATESWRKANPGKFKRWKIRNGVKD